MPRGIGYLPGQRKAIANRSPRLRKYGAGRVGKRKIGGVSGYRGIRTPRIG